MLIAQAKRKENIVEYLLYMFQLEDLLRAIQFDAAYIRNEIVAKMSTDPEQQKEIEQWYLNLVGEMKHDKVEDQGHPESIKEVISELILLDSMLQQQLKDEKYVELCQTTQTFVQELREKSNNDQSAEVMVCLNAIYAKLLLKLKREKISEASEEAFQSFTQRMAYLSQKYKAMYAGAL